MKSILIDNHPDFYVVLLGGMVWTFGLGVGGEWLGSYAALHEVNCLMGTKPSERNHAKAILRIY